MAVTAENAGAATSSVTATEEKASAVHIELKKKEVKEKLRAAYKPTEYSITEVDISFDLDYDVTRVETTLTMHRREGAPHGSDLVLDGEDLRLLTVALNGEPLSVSSPLASDAERKCYLDAYGQLVISGRILPEKADEVFNLSTTVEIRPKENLSLSGLFKSEGLLLTQCEAEGFRRITYFLDRPDILAMYKCKMTASKEMFPHLLSNGNCIEEGDVGTDKHFAVYRDPHPKPCYLFAVVAGQMAKISRSYQHPKKPEGKKVDVHIWGAPEHAAKLEWAMESITRAMVWDEDVFGLEYDLDVFHIVAVRDFAMGAMENKSLNIFVANLLLATPDLAADVDYGRILGVVGHEYFHNWTGNRVTCRDWFQLTLKEGLTVFRDQEFSSDMGSRAVQRIEDVILLRDRQFCEDEGPMSHPIRPESYIAMSNFYSTTVYYKGAEVIRMYQTILGRSGFRKGMDLYFKRHDGSAVTCDDFRAAMADANGFDFTQFERWYIQSGTPIVTVVSTNYDSAAKVLKFTLKQETPVTPKQPSKMPFHIPVLMGLIGKVSKTEICATRLLHLTQAEQEFEIADVSEEPHLSLFRNYSAPIKLVQEMTDQELSFQMGYDTDPFNRWDAGQKLMSRIILARAKSIVEGADGTKPEPLSPTVIESLRAVLNDTSLDRSFMAYALLLPTEDSLANDMRPCDPVAIHTARSALRKQIRAALYEDMRRHYDDLSKVMDGKAYAYLPASENVAPRQLRNLLLSYLACEENEDAVQLAVDHCAKANNVTDRIAALKSLVNFKSNAKDDALNKFFVDAAGEGLIIDKWFALQTGTETDEALDIAKKLKDHPLFTIKTPSRMRTVVTRFAMNSAQFHRIDGLGYKFIADAAIEIDGFSSALAARLTSAYLVNYRIYNEARQKLLRAELQRMMDTNTLQAELYEVVKKALL